MIPSSLLPRFTPTLVAATAFAGTALADVSLPSLFSDHMVLQKDVPVPVWGWAEAGEEVSVAIGGQTKTTKAGTDGKWRVKLDKLKAADATTLTVKAKNTVTINDVLVGEVWLCSGQSNMAWTVNRSLNFEQEQAAAKLPKIRMFTVASGAATEPQEKCNGQWVVCSPETVANFSATGYFFGRELHAKLGTAVGLINSSVGGTPIEAWTSLEAQQNLPEVKPIFERWEKQIAAWDPEKAKAQFEKQKAEYNAAVEKAKTERKPTPRPPRPPVDPKTDAHRPANLFNGKIAPLVPYAMRGAIWYQGESNAGSVEGGLAYRKQLPAMIGDWRKRWGQGDFPFAWVQLPDYNAANSEGWCLVREAMMQSLKVPHTGMATTLGLGEARDIHPKNKQDVGKRLGMWALADVYGQKGASCGPIYTEHKIGGGKVTLTFKHADGGLLAKDGELKGFVIAGEDKQWKPATAKIEGTKIVVASPEVKEPVAVRYAWASNPEFNLFNGAGLPASPFRTDDWPVTNPAPQK